MPNDGGLAFPSSRMEDVSTEGTPLPLMKEVHYSGMTMRDYFAAMALNGIRGVAGTEGVTIKWAAEEAYKIADAMLEARKEGGQP